MSVCLFVCLSVYDLTYLKSQILPNYLYMLPAAVAQSSSQDNEICYVLPVSWMTSRFHIMEGIGQNQRQIKGVCFVQFARWQHLGAKFVVFDCILVSLTYAAITNSYYTQANNKLSRKTTLCTRIERTQPYVTHRLAWALSVWFTTCR